MKHKVEKVVKTTYKIGKQEFKHEKDAEMFKDFMQVPYDRIKLQLNHKDLECRWPKDQEYRIVFDRVMSMKSQFDYVRALFENWVKL